MNKRCPECHKRIDIHWIKCWNCGYDFADK